MWDKPAFYALSPGPEAFTDILPEILIGPLICHPPMASPLHAVFVRYSIGWWRLRPLCGIVLGGGGCGLCAVFGFCLGPCEFCAQLIKAGSLL